tara:strand:+ start:743 stop:1264 length:522 start_codon:yes stop_codon:yes gene_type:complete
MNIFAIEKTKDGQIDWAASAKSQDNYRVVKMILECCQMLCAVLNEQYGYQASPYRTTHKNHPSTRWVAESSANFLALVNHCESMIEEYEERFDGRIHKCKAVLAECVSLFEPARFPKQFLTRLPLAMPDEYKSDDIVESYRRFYASKPRVRYPEEKIPEWFNKYRNDVPYEVL